MTMCLGEVMVVGLPNNADFVEVTVHASSNDHAAISVVSNLALLTAERVVDDQV